MADTDDSTPQLTVQTSEEGDGVVLLTVAGELDLATAPQVSAAASAALERDPDRVVFDLAGLAFMDSSGLRVLLEVANQTTVILRTPSEPVRRVIESTGVNTIIKIEG